MERSSFTPFSAKRFELPDDVVRVREALAPAHEERHAIRAVVVAPVMMVVNTLKPFSSSAGMPSAMPALFLPAVFKHALFTRTEPKGSCRAKGCNLVCANTTLTNGWR